MIHRVSQLGILVFCVFIPIFGWTCPNLTGHYSCDYGHFWGGRNSYLRELTIKSGAQPDGTYLYLEAFADRPNFARRLKADGQRAYSGFGDGSIEMSTTTCKDDKMIRESTSASGTERESMGLDEQLNLVIQDLDDLSRSVTCTRIE